eukprot:1413735-Amphidinium_carterae.1
MELVDALRSVQLGYLLERYGLSSQEAWSSVLSLGEQQRIGFARVLLRKGLRLALIDEGTSGCDPANEALLYSMLAQHVCSYVSVGHRPALRHYHSHVLCLQHSDGLSTSDSSQPLSQWAFMTMEDYNLTHVACEAKS